MTGGRFKVGFQVVEQIYWLGNIEKRNQRNFSARFLSCILGISKIKRNFWVGLPYFMQPFISPLRRKMVCQTL